MNQNFVETLDKLPRLHVRQMFEGFELLGFETRNKYQIMDDHQKLVAYAAEQTQGIGMAILRQMVGHWRSFEIVIFSPDRQVLYRLKFPFRWFFKTLIVEDASGKHIGTFQERFAIFRKKFDLIDNSGRVEARVNSSFFRFWTFEFEFASRKLATVKKKWSGILGEMFTDKDNFVVEFEPTKTDADFRVMALSACLMFDIDYFENNQGKKGINFFD